MTTEPSISPPWSVKIRIEDVPDTGLSLALSADAPTRAAIADFVGVQAVHDLTASFAVTRAGRGLHVAGDVKAVVGQLCVVTLDPIENAVAEIVDVDFLPPPLPSDAAAGAGSTQAGTDDDPEPLVDGTVDLGALAIEFLILGIDPYPRKPDARFEPPAVDNGHSGPFAGLARLKPGLEPKK